MREIIFRGKRIDSGEWLEGILYNGKHYTAIHDERFCDCWDGFKEVEPSTVGQFTGLTDKNGIKVFEGDVIKTPYYIFGKEAGTETHAIAFDSGVFGVKRGCDFTRLSALRTPTEWEYVSNVGEVATKWVHPFEVIGNIHDNPELLK